MRDLKSFFRDRRGASVIEYGMIAALLHGANLAGMAGIGTHVWRALFG